MRDTRPVNQYKFEFGGFISIFKLKKTHWTCYSKNGRECCYLDSYGVNPPIYFEKT